MIYLPRFVAFVLMGFLVGCGSSGVKQTSGSAVRGLHVAEVVVKANATALSEYEKNRLKEREVDQLVAKEIRSRLAAENKLASKGPVMTVTIKDFHIRSTTAAVLAGAMAGTDFIEADVQVAERGRVLKSYTARAKAVRGYGSEDRILKMAEILAEDLVEEL